MVSGTAVVLTIGGSDPSSGAGVQVDLKVLSKLDVAAYSVITVITVQNRSEFKNVYPLPLNVIQEQLRAVFDDMDISYVKLGMLFSSDIVRVVSSFVGDRKLIVDPILMTTMGGEFYDESLISSYKNYIFPNTYLLTPNIPEAEVFCNLSIESVEDMREACICIRGMGVENVLLKGGHSQHLKDILYMGNRFYEFEGSRIEGKFHGTGCVMASLITGFLSKGYPLMKAVERAKGMLTSLLQHPLLPPQGKKMAILV